MLESLMPSLGLIDLVLLGVRLLCLVFIIHWVRRRITDSTAVTLITLVLSYLLLFRWAGLWIPIILLIVVLPHGPLNLMFDLALGGGAGAEEAKKKKSKVKKARKA